MTSLFLYFYLKEPWLNHRAARPGCFFRWGVEKTQTAEQGEFERCCGSGSVPMIYDLLFGFL